MRKWALQFVFISLLAASCDSVDNSKNEKVKGNGQVTSENRNAGGPFTGNVRYKGNVTPTKTITGNGSITQVQ